MILPLRTYAESPSFAMPQVYLSEDAYGKAMESLIIVCADVLFINRARRTVFLAKRLASPLPGLWVIGGRLFAGECERDGAQRCVARETGLSLEAHRFSPLCMNRYICPVRKQPPQEKGSDTMAYTFLAELLPDELGFASDHLDPDEYDTTFGVQEFSRERLVQEDARQALLDMYDLAFSEKESQ
jgi:hypothetical protein